MDETESNMEPLKPPPSPRTNNMAEGAHKTPSKNRSFSDSTPTTTNTPSKLAPSPAFREPQTKDDHSIPFTPRASRRPDMLYSLQMPNLPSPSRFPPQPLSPKLDQDNIYMQPPPQTASPATSLPRHSRGLDFSRASTNLHHSTLADCSPGSSPVISQKGMMIPGRRESRKGSINSMMLDSPNINGGSMPWGTVSSSVGSGMAVSESERSSDSDEDASMDDNEDPIFTTPQVHKLQNPNAPTPFAGPPTTPSGGGGGMWGSGTHFSPAQASLMKTIRRSRLQKNDKKSRKRSSSASGSGYSSMASPRTTSPPPMRSIETAANGAGHFNWANAARSRRESLALGTDKLQLSSGNDSGDEASQQTTPSTPGVVRRAVTRRGNLLPKTKGFARIRAALIEESAPVDTEVRREAETIRQVRERDGSVGELDFERPQTATDQSSPNLLPAVPEAIQEDLGKDLDNEPTTAPKGLGMNFAMHANRNSGGLDYWNRFDPTLRTPPPPNFARLDTNVLSDTNMDSEPNSTNTPLWRRPRARSSASEASEAFAPNSSGGGMQASGVNDDVHIKKFKRRREDDFDIATIKRRAVSPGMSAQNSPVLAHSPSQKDANASWGQPPERKSDRSNNTNNLASAGSEASQGNSRHGSGGSSISLASGNTLTQSVSNSAAGGGGGNAGQQGRKLGLQGMVDTNDGLMKMSIE